jgi:hypothetical protein
MGVYESFLAVVAVPMIGLLLTLEMFIPQTWKRATRIATSLTNRLFTVKDDVGGAAAPGDGNLFKLICATAFICMANSVYKIWNEHNHESIKRSIERCHESDGTGLLAAQCTQIGNEKTALRWRHERNFWMEFFCFTLCMLLRKFQYQKSANLCLEKKIKLMNIFKSCNGSLNDDNIRQQVKDIQGCEKFCIKASSKGAKLRAIEEADPKLSGAEYFADQVLKKAYDEN